MMLTRAQEDFLSAQQEFANQTYDLILKYAEYKKYLGQKLWE